MNKIGVVIVSMNNLEMTKKAVASISTAKHELYTVLVDNNSTDGTVVWAKEYGFSSLILNEINQGVSIAWNQGIMDCYLNHCDFITVMNNDIILDPDCLDTIAQKFLDNPNSHVILRCYHGGFSCFMMTPFCWEKIGEFDEEFSRIGKAYFEDNDYVRRINMSGHGVLPDHDALARHFMSKTRDQLGPEKHKLFIANRNYYLKKWGGLPGKEKYTKPFNNK